MSLEKLKEEAINPQTSLLRLQQIAQTNDDNNELAKLIASNPNANNESLEMLAIRADKNKDLETQKAIVSNPNTPVECLLKFAYQFPEQLFENPIGSSAFSMIIC